MIIFACSALPFSYYSRDILKRKETRCYLFRGFIYQSTKSPLFVNCHSKRFCLQCDGDFYCVQYVLIISIYTENFNNQAPRNLNGMLNCGYVFISLYFTAIYTHSYIDLCNVKRQ